ncbi:hypothetical protein FKP32DRAFT_69819 [Trametes sanguinea]|nr:hypothetical protein FKP32DRAFT_69819 [Trametes sanguinea]
MENYNENANQGPARPMSPSPFLEFVADTSRQYAQSDDPIVQMVGKSLLATLQDIVTQVFGQGPSQHTQDASTPASKEPLRSSTVANISITPPKALLPQASSSKPSTPFPFQMDSATAFQFPAQHTPPAFIDRLPASPDAHKPQATDSNKDVEPDVLDEKIPPPPEVTCQWGGCVGVVMKPERFYDDHMLASDSAKGHGQAVPQTGQVRCLWAGCSYGRPMNRESLKRHMECSHLGMKWMKCGRCGTIKREDAYKTCHGPARYCNRPKVKRSRLPTSESPGPSNEVSPVAGPSTQPLAAPPMSLPANPPLPPLPSMVGPTRQSKTRRRARTTRVQGNIAYPPSTAPAMAVPEAEQSMDTLPPFDLGLPVDVDGWLALSVPIASGSSTQLTATPPEEAAPPVPSNSQEQSAPAQDLSLDAFMAAISGEFDTLNDFNWSYSVDENRPPQA